MCRFEQNISNDVKKKQQNLMSNQNCYLSIYILKIHIPQIQKLQITCFHLSYAERQRTL